MHHKKQCSFRITCDKSATSLFESGEECHVIKVINNNNNSQEERVAGNQNGARPERTRKAMYNVHSIAGLFAVK